MRWPDWINLSWMSKDVFTVQTGTSVLTLWKVLMKILTRSHIILAFVQILMFPPQKKRWNHARITNHDMEGKLHQKNNLKSFNDRTALKQCWKELDNESHISKRPYRSKLKGYLKVNHTWDGLFSLNTITGYKTRHRIYYLDSCNITGFIHILTSQIPGLSKVKFKDLFNEFTNF